MSEARRVCRHLFPRERHFFPERKREGARAPAYRLCVCSSKRVSELVCFFVRQASGNGSYAFMVVCYLLYARGGVF